MDGSAWENGGDASRRVVRGGSWADDPRFLRSGYRVTSSPDYRDGFTGLRIARTF
jgi:formylglycine-generating enzyme required for sulfatase activity